MVSGVIGEGTDHFRNSEEGRSRVAMQCDMSIGWRNIGE